MHEKENRGDILVLRHQRDALGSEIIEMERKLETAHEEYGSNSPEDNSQEAASEFINRSILGEQIGLKRKQMEALNIRIAGLEHAA